MVKIVASENFNKKIDNKEVGLFLLKNKNGLVCQISNYGARIISLFTPDKNGVFEDIVLGYDNLENYINSSKKYYGAVIGRYSNRIKNAKFSIGSTEYQITQNKGNHHIHGGEKGFNKVVWDVLEVKNQSLRLAYLSKDREEGFPGNLKVEILYTLTDQNELKIEYFATTDKATPVNLTQHSYFNLKGAGNGSIENHEIKINSSHYALSDEDSIPTGEFQKVINTPMDFNAFKTIGSNINDDFEQLKLANGYDHSYIFDNPSKETNLVAEVLEPVSKRKMQVYTNETSMQFYSGNFSKDLLKGKEDKIYDFRSAFCLETQHLPDSPNQKEFPNTILEKEDDYYSICIYQFSTY